MPSYNVIAKYCNDYYANDTTKTLGKKLRSIPSLHAEIGILLKSGILTEYILIQIILKKKFKKPKLSSKTLTVIRLSKDNKYKDATPCCLCRSVLIKLGFKKIYYSNCHGDIICSKPKEIKSKISSGIKEEKKYAPSHDIIHLIK